MIVHLVIPILLIIVINQLPISGNGSASFTEVLARIFNSSKVLSVAGGDCGRLDSNSDNKLTIIDLANLAARFNSNCATPEYVWGCGSLDTNANGAVDTTDLNYLLSKYNNSCHIGAEFFVADNGSAAGDGTIANPWDLQTALNKSAQVISGSTLWLRGGNYGSGGGTVYNSTLNGTEAQPIVIKSYPGEWAIVDGGFDTNSAASWLWFWGFEITNTTTNRNVDYVNIKRTQGINMYSRGFRVINMYIHDVGHPAIGFWQQVENGGEVYGNVVWGSGIYDMSPQWAGGIRGAAIYAQNQIGTRKIENNIMFSNFSTGLSIHGEAGYVNGFRISNNTVFNNGQADSMLYSINHGVDNYVLDSNSFYEYPDTNAGRVNIGYFGSNNSAVITNNIFPSHVYMKNWQSLQFANNTIISKDSLLELNGAENITYENNTYYGGGADLLINGATKYKDRTSFLNFLGDSGATYTKNQPTFHKVIIRPNKYEFGKAFATVYNYDLRTEVSLNLNGVLGNGDKYIVRDVFDYSNPIASGVFTGQPVVLPTSLYKFQPLIGNNPVNHRHTAPELLNYVIERVDADAAPQVEAVKIASASLSFTGSNANMQLTTTTPEATIHYTLDDSEPTASSPVATGNILITQDTIVKTFAKKTGYIDGPKLRFAVNKLDLQSNLVGSYEFAEQVDSATVNNSVVGGILPSGLVMGPVSRLPGPNGNAINFSGSPIKNYVGFSGVYNSTNKFSVSFMAKVDEGAPSGTIIGNGGSQLSTTNYIVSYLNNSGVSSMSFQLGTTAGPILAATTEGCQNVFSWNFYTATFDQNSLKFYCNATLKASSVNPGYQAGSGNVLSLGRLGNYADSSYFKGNIDDVKIYHNQSLTAAEVKATFEQYKNQVD